MPNARTRTLAVLLLLLAAMVLPAPRSEGTWSIVITDRRTNEVSVGTVTCLNSLDLLAIVPVVVVGEGAAACQAAGDFNGQRRPVIYNGFLLDRPPASILLGLSTIGGHQQRQYGIVDTEGEAVTFTGSSTIAWAGGVTGTDGDLAYAIQGNILTGPCVVQDIEAALLAEPGDMAAKLMAGMEAARDAGGDGRCSCPGDPTGCGCPPRDFTKSGHIGGMIVARAGDVDDPACTAGGCADGQYYMRLNVPNQPSGAPDPVDQLRDLYDAWRAALDGVVDALRTTATLPASVPANGTSVVHLRIDPRDLDGDAATVDPPLVEHAADSDGLATIGAPVLEDDGTWTIALTAGTAPGLDRFRVALTDAGTGASVVVSPFPTLASLEPGDLDGDGTIGFGDLLALLADWGPCPGPELGCPGDLDGDGTSGFEDLLVLLAGWDAG